jgi:hypothetical protein
VTKPLSLAQAASQARSAIDKFVSDLARSRDDLSRLPEATANAVNGVRPYFAGLPTSDQDMIVARISAATRRNPAWVRRLFALSEMDVRRAIRSREPKWDRHGHETLYPSDGWIGAYLLYAQDSEAPLAWHFWCAVATLGMVARRNFYWDRGRYILYLNHYLLIVGPTGLKKSTTMNQAMALLKLADQKVQDIRNDKPPPFYFSPDRVTPEALDAELSAWTKANPDAKDTICGLVNDEVATLLGKNVWGSDKLIHFLTAIYGGAASYRDASIGRGKREMKNIQVTALFGSTADWIRDSVTDEMLGGGFLGRCVIVPREDPHGIFPEPPPSDPVVMHTLAEALIPWISLSGLVECRRTKEATSWYEEWYLSNKAGKPSDPRLEGWWNRKDDHLHKLAAILRIAELIASGEGAYEELIESRVLLVGLRTFHQAISILDVEENHLPKLLAQIGANIVARANERVLLIIEQEYRRTKTPVSHSRVLQKSVHFIGGAWEFRRAIETLREQNLVTVAHEGGPMGRGKTYLPTWAAAKGEGPIPDDKPANG